MISSKAVDLGIFSYCGGSLSHGYTPGHGWASKRETIEKCGFYDAMILGSGDKVMTAAAYGQANAVASAFRFTESQIEHYFAWARPFFTAVKGRVGHLPCKFAHLRHGSLENRRYDSRYRGFAQWQFCPYEDLGITKSGCWEWKTNKSGLHQHVESYMQYRGEQG